MGGEEGAEKSIYHTGQMELAVLTSGKRFDTLQATCWMRLPMNHWYLWHLSYPRYNYLYLDQQRHPQWPQPWQPRREWGASAWKPSSLCCSELRCFFCCFAAACCGCWAQNGHCTCNLLLLYPTDMQAWPQTADAARKLHFLLTNSSVMTNDLLSAD